MEKGFTLVELIIVMAIFTIISIAIFTLGRDTFFFNSIIQDSFNTQEEAKRVIRPLATELRVTRIGVNGSYPIDMTGTSTLIFYSDVNLDGNTEKVRYFLSDAILKRGVITPSGSPLSYSGTEKITELVHGVRNTNIQPVFEYFDSGYTGTTSPMTYPISVSNVRLVKVNLYADLNANRSPTKQYITTQVQIRNLKDNQ